jgi:hypothetical protein
VNNVSWTDGSLGVDDVGHLAAHLRRVPKVAQVVGLDDIADDSWAIAEGLRDIRESCAKLFTQLVPELLEVDPAGNRAPEILHEIGELLRHIRYHTSDSRYYGYLADSPGAEDDRELE